MKVLKDKEFLYLYATASSGVWASMVSGFGGLRTDGNLLIFNPALPEKWDSYKFKLCYAGAILKVEVDQEAVTFTIESGPGIMVKVYGREVLINANGIKIKL